jgi:hypothetical protein
MQINEAVSNQRAKAEDWGFGESKEKQTPFFWVLFSFLDITGDHGEKLTIRKDFYLTDNTIEYVLMDLRKMGWIGRDLTEWEKGQPNSFDFSKVETEITTELQEYLDTNGNTKKIAKIKFIGGANTPTLEATKFKGLAAKMKGKIAAFNAKNPSAKTSVAAMGAIPLEKELPEPVLRAG